MVPGVQDEMPSVLRIDDENALGFPAPRVHALDLGEYGRMDVKRYVARKDALRETFCKVYTGADIWNVENYDLCLNSCLLGPDTCVDLIEKVLEKY